MSTETESSSRLDDLLRLGSAIAGGALAGALGFLAVGPVGGAGAAIAGILVERALVDFACRQLSQRERVRSGAAAAFALAGMKAKLDAGKSPRDDGFFARKGERPSDAEELLEGVLQKAKNEHEERKIRCLGTFYSNVAFSPGVSSAEANHLLRVAEGLSYRQMCVLRLLILKEEIPSLVLRNRDYRGPNVCLSAETISLLQEIYEMTQQGLVLCRIGPGHSYEALLGWHDVVPAGLQLAFLGERLAGLLGFSDPPYEDVDLVATSLAV